MGTAGGRSRRRRFRLRRAGMVLLAATLVAVVSPAASASTADVASIRTVASAGLAKGSAITLIDGDGGERTRLLLPVAEAELMRRGFVVDGGAAWRLTLTTVAAEESLTGPFRLYGRIGSASRPDVTLEVPLPEWPGPSREAAYRYNVAMTLGRPGRPPIWQGAGSAALDSADGFAAERRLIAALLDRFGQTTAPQPVPLD